MTFPQFVSSSHNLHPVSGSNVIQIPWPEFETWKTKSTVGRHSDSDAAESFGRQVRNPSIISSRVVPSYCETFDGLWSGSFLRFLGRDDD